AWLQTIGGNINVIRVRAGIGAWLQSAGGIYSLLGGAVHDPCCGEFGHGANITAPFVGLLAAGTIGFDPSPYNLSEPRPVRPVTVDALSVAARAGGNLTLHGVGGLYGGGDLRIGDAYVNLADSGMFIGGPAGSLSGITAGGTAHLLADRNIVSLLPHGATAITADRLAYTVGNAAGRPSAPIKIDITGRNDVDIWGGRLGPYAGNEPVTFGFFTGPSKWKPRVAAPDCSGAVIFYDGQYMGGAPKYIVRIAASESYPADTPELKSRLGVFSEPLFVHDQIDIVQSPSLGFIEHLIPNADVIEVNREFPAVFRRMEIQDGGLKPRNTWWFDRAGGSNDVERAEAIPVASLD
ncbi:MAG: hypothetical protein FWF96_07590, partial [Kiritimatiellaeota bacterium]|nr:hypothetical protein [Kiritimatiellota bacterium]